MLKVSEMDDEQLGELIHTHVMGECWHDVEYGQKGSVVFSCKKCPVDGLDAPSNPDYCTDLNAVAKAEAKAANPNSYAHYEDTLLEVIRREHSKKDWREYNNSYLSYLLIHSTARQRCEAVCLAMNLVGDES